MATCRAALASLALEYKPMAFVLIATSRGDELFPPTKKVIAVSEFRGVLEKMRVERAAERESWLDTHSVSRYQKCVIIAKEEIEEVPTAI